MGTGDEAGEVLDNPGTDSGPAAGGRGVNLDNSAELGSEVALLVVSQSPVPLSRSRTWCPFP